MTTSEDWDRLDALLDGALDQDPESRLEWLVSQCAGDEALLARARALLDMAVTQDEDLVQSGALRGEVFDEVAEELDGGGPDSMVAGRRIGPYEVVGLLGAGGMGRVYRARDTVLGREVAVKALTAELADDETNLRRFEREARLLATVSHPNIASIHGLHVIDGRPYLVMELVEGATLDERIGKGALPFADAVRIARQVAEALEEAHGKGIVHRDLKPSNVKVGRSGRVKVLDFGLARRVQPGSGAEISQSGNLTREGAILGTVPYMSPEQARGEAVDGRSDVWALGCLLFEMLSGRRPFEGRTVTELLASVLRDEVDLERLPPGTPPGLRRLVRRCLTKDLHRRLQHVGDVRLELQEMEEGADGELVRSAGAGGVARVVPWVLAALAAAVAGFALLRSVPARQPAPSAPKRLVLDLPPGVSLPTGDYASPLALSPDGTTAVLLGEAEPGTGRLYRRRLASLEWVELPGTERAWQPFFSADGQEVGFFADRRLKRIALDGTSPTTVAEIGANPRGASWAPDGTIVIGPTQTAGLVRVDARGGVPAPLTELDPSADERSHRWPQVLPGGRSALFTIDFEESTFDDAALAVVSLDTGERRVVLRGGAHGRYVPSGHVVYARGGRLFAVPFDLERLVVTGTPVQVVDGVAYDLRNGGTKIAVAEDGALAYVTGQPASLERKLVWVDARGELTPLTDGRRFLDPRLSPDGSRVAVRIGDPAESDVWTLDLASGALSQVTFGRACFRPVWTADGRGLTVGELRDGGWRLVTIRPDGRVPDVTLLESANRLYPGDWSSDGRTLVFQERTGDAGWNIGSVAVDAEGRPVGDPRPVLATDANEMNPSLSPDDRFVAYESDEMDGLVAVYVRPFGGSGASVKASSGGGRWPQWGRPGQLHYWSSFTRRMIRVHHHIRDRQFLLDSEEVLWASAKGPVEVPVSEHLGFGFDLDPASGRFLMMESVASATHPVEPRLVLALGWAGDLQARRP